MGFHTFEIEALLLVFPTIKYQKRVPVAIGTTITDMAVDFIHENNPENVSKSWNAVCSKPVTLPPFSTTIIKGSTKLRSHVMRLNQLAESSTSTQLPLSVQCAPTYCTLEPGSNRVAVGLKIFLLDPLKYHQGLLWVNYNRPRW